MENKQNNRNVSIDLLKGIAALLVCFQHACGEGLLSEFLLSISRVAVPLFVMTTAYMYYDTVEKGREVKQIIRFVKIAIQIVAFYFLLDIVYQLVSHHIVDYLQTLINPSAIKNFFVFNDPIPGEHSWYMWAMVYVLGIMYFVPGLYRNKTIRNTIAIVSVLSSVLISKYYIVISSQAHSALLYRNFLIPVMGYFCLGISIREFEKKRKISKNILIVTMIIAIVCLFVEKTLFLKVGVDRTSGWYLLTPALAVFIFEVILQSEPVNGIGRLIAEFGEKYSLLFYILHPFFVKIEVRIFDMNGWQQIIGILFVYIASVVASIVIRKKIWKISLYCR
ncbi:MAG: acyltransferase [Bacteroides sp.]|nr:acyltransferase [Bacteroides sp.]